MLHSQLVKVVADERSLRAAASKSLSVHPTAHGGASFPEQLRTASARQSYQPARPEAIDGRLSAVCRLSGAWKPPAQSRDWLALNKAID